MTPQMLSDARSGLAGVVRLLFGQPGYHAHFDVSAGGVARSFSAALIALPLAFVTTGLANAIIAADAQGRPMGATQVLTRWALMWAYFPLLAAGVARLVGRPERFAPWVVVHNWTHLLIVAIQIVPFAFLSLGFVQPGSLLFIASIVFIAYAYVRVADAALEVGAALAIGAGAANLLCTLAIDVLVGQVFAPG